MTGRRPSRGPGDPWRGGRPARPEDPDRKDVELEELPVQAVARRGRSRLSVPSVLAAVALVGLLAAGFGALGGRPEASIASPAGTLPTDVAAESPSSRPSNGQPPQPAVTPNRICGALPDDLPEVYLGVDGNPTPGEVRVETGTLGSPPDASGRLVAIPAGAVVQVLIEGAACAVAWDITLLMPDGELVPLETQQNADLDPRFASQNRFDLDLSFSEAMPEVAWLYARLEFPGQRIVARWPVVLVIFERPRAVLRVAGEVRSFPTVEGCTFFLAYRNGSEEGHYCERDLSGPLPPPAKIEPGTPLLLAFEGWSVLNSTPRCGAVTDRVFEPLATPCWDASALTFPAPPRADVVISIAACAEQDAIGWRNEICGTWYARVDTR